MAQNVENVTVYNKTRNVSVTTRHGRVSKVTTWRSGVYSTERTTF